MRVGLALAVGIGAASAVAGFTWRALRPPPGAPVRIVVDGARRHQTIDGWGVYPRYWEDNKREDRFDGSFERVVEPVSKLLVNSVGINAVRLEVWSGMENPTDRWTPYRAGKMGYKEWARLRYEKINDNPDPRVADSAGFQMVMFDYRYETMVLPLKRALEARGETLYLSLCYVDFKWNNTTEQGTLSHARSPEEYAELVLVYFKHLREKYGVVPDAFEMVLEPENTEGWRGANIGRAVVAVTDRLRENGFTPEIVAPSTSTMSNALTYFDEMVQVPGAAGRLGTFGYHRYGQVRESHVEAIAARASRYRLKTAMLEKVDAGIDALLQDLTVGNVSGWQQWAIAGNARNADNGGYYLRVDDANPAAPTVAMARHSAQLAEVFLQVRGGAVRIESRSGNADKRAAAFINRDGSWVVVIRARTAGAAVRVGGLPPGRYVVKFLGDGGFRTDPGTVTVTRGGELKTRIPEAGVMTVYGVETP